MFLKQLVVVVVVVAVASEKGAKMQAYLYTYFGKQSEWCLRLNRGFIQP